MPARIARAFRSAAVLVVPAVAAPAANAQFVHFAPSAPIRVGPGQSFDIDLDSSGTVDFTLRMTTVSPILWGDEFAIYLSAAAGSATLLREPSGNGMFGDELVRSVPSGGVISGALDWCSEYPGCVLALEARRLVSNGWSYGFQVEGDWVGVDRAIAPLRFLGSDGLPRFGWLNARSLGPAGGEILRWAYETTPNTPIIAGAVPAPGAAALLALGGLLAGRRRR